jgi:hypothetical protein
MRSSFRAIRFAGMAAASVALLALAACGSSSPSSATTQASSSTCPTATTAIKFVTGTISQLSASSATVASNGQTTVVHFTSNTRITTLQTVSASTLTAGTRVEIFTQSSNGSSPTVAQAILVANAGASGRPGFNGTPGAGRGGRSFNPSCARRGQGLTQLGFRGLSGQITTINTTSSQLTITDAQGTSYAVTFTSTTAIAQTVRGSISDLAVGDTINASGQAASDGLTATSITDFKSLKL